MGCIISSVERTSKVVPFSSKALMVFVLLISGEKKRDPFKIQTLILFHLDPIKFFSSFNSVSAVSAMMAVGFHKNQKSTLKRQAVHSPA
jgi:hypothetical protein